MENFWRSRFPLFKHHPDLAYLDSAATTQRVDTVIDAMHTFSISGNANVYRGVYTLSNLASELYENTRKKIADFVKAPSALNIGFTKGTTEAINIVAQGFLDSRLKKGDRVVVSIMEHHSNFLPWQKLCDQKGAELIILGLNEEGKLDLKEFEKLIDSRTKMVAISHISNVLGRINSVREVAKFCNSANIPFLIDAAQSAALHQLNVQQLGCDFLVFSGHKIFGPMGTGVLYVSDTFRGEIEPNNLGGGMIRTVSRERSDFREFPFCLEAGTPNVQGIIGLGAAIDFIDSIDTSRVLAYVRRLTLKFCDELSRIDGCNLLLYSDYDSGIVSFIVESVHAHDVAGFLNRDKVAVRAGIHCAQPLLNYLNVDATIRVSFSIYNTEQEVDLTIKSLRNCIRFWS